MTVNFKGIGFWFSLFCAHVCAAIAYGPKVGALGFIGLACAVMVFG